VSAAHVTIARVSKRFGSHHALTDVSVDITDGESIVVVGPSGCGKTTLLRLIAGLEAPDNGEVWLAGRQVSGAGRATVPPHERGIGYVFQDLALWPHLTVQRHLDFVLESAKTPRSERRLRTQEVLTLVRIEQLSDRYPHQLSGGEQQRVAIARALVGQPRLLLLDEPLSSLDPELRATLREELVRLRTALHVTAVYVTHDREDVAALANRVVQMRGGRIVSFDTETEREARA
jgi:ABC-type Fe3+/spermidine/putrescine transport system ATPase subunit